MKKGDKLYRFIFDIKINYYIEKICGNLFAKDDNEALNKLPKTIQKRIGFISIKTTNINLYRKNDLIRHFTNFEDMLQELTKA